MSKYAYPSIFTQEESGMYAVRFPDIKCCFTSGENLADALKMAQDALCLLLYDKEDSKENIPAPSTINDIHTEVNDIVSFVSCDTLEYRKQYDNSAIKKTLTISTWLNTIAEKQGVNFSQVLQDALKDKLNVG